MEYRAIVMGVSSGGGDALTKILPALPKELPLPVVIVQHLHYLQDLKFIQHYNKVCKMAVNIAGEKQAIAAGHIYFAPPNYHLLIEKDETFSLSIDERVNYSRPSIDVLFESAADVYCPGLIGVILTGANADGAAGLRQIKNNKGLTIVQDPATAAVDYMPRAAIAAVDVDHVLPLEDIGPYLARLVMTSSHNRLFDSN